MSAVGTKVVPELMKTQPDVRVVSWASTIPDGGIAVPALVLAVCFAVFVTTPLYQGCNRQQLG